MPDDMVEGQTRKSTIRHTAIRETYVSRHHWSQIKDLIWVPIIPRGPSPFSACVLRRSSSWHLLHQNNKFSNRAIEKLNIQYHVHFNPTRIRNIFIHVYTLYNVRLYIKNTKWIISTNIFRWVLVTDLFVHN